MTAQFNVEKPADVRITLTMTLPLASWREISRQLQAQTDGRGTSYPLVRVIDDMTHQVTQTFWPSSNSLEKDVSHE